MPGERGLSLTELLVVVAILGVVAAVVVPSSATRVERPLDLAAQEVAEAFRFARNESLRLAAPHGVSEDTAAMSIRVFSLDEGVSPPSPVFDVYHPVRKQPYDVTLDGLALAGVDAVARSAVYRGTCNAPGDVYFDPQGTPWCADPGNVLLEQLDLTLTRAGQTRVVSLHGITGRVTVQ